MDLYSWNPTGMAQIEKCGLEHVPGSRVQPLQRSYSHKLKLVLLHRPSTTFPPHDVLAVFIHSFTCTDTLALEFALGKDPEKEYVY